MIKLSFAAKLGCSAAFALLAVSLLAGRPSASNEPVPAARDKCPVCGMFVAKYPDWTATIEFRNGRREWFDGVKDLLRFYLTPERYGYPKRTVEAAAIRVKDYYSLSFINGRQAYYVMGSDVLGPMGKELMPFARNADAAEFLKDHRGKRILRFGDLTPVVVKELE